MCQARAMAFEQPKGPPASHRQVKRLLDLVNDAGYAGFRDARGPLGLSQRQGNGKFTRNEADELIARLEGDDHDPSAPTPPARPAAADVSLGGIPDEVLAAELQRRGWIVMEP
jgi:hypothetical protein